MLGGFTLLYTTKSIISDYILNCTSIRMKAEAGTCKRREMSLAVCLSLSNCTSTKYRQLTEKGPAVRRTLLLI